MITSARSATLSRTLSTRIGLGDRKSTRLNSSHGYNSYAVFCLKKKNRRVPRPIHRPRIRPNGRLPDCPRRDLPPPLRPFYGDHTYVTRHAVPLSPSPLHCSTHV